MVGVKLTGLPEGSVADQVRRITRLQESPDSLELKVTVKLASQLSLAVTVGAAGTLVAHWTLRVAEGRPINTGGWLSNTVTVKVHWLRLPLLSCAVLVTVVVPTGKAKLLGGTLINSVTAQLSVAITLNVTLLVHVPGAALTVILPGHETAGASVSLTVTVKVHWLRLPLLSRAVLVTIVVPTGKAKPLDGPLTTFATAQLSVAVTLKVTLLVQAPGAAFTVIFPGHVMSGGCVSLTVTVKRQKLLLPFRFHAVVVTVVVPTGKAKPLGGRLTRFVTAQLSVAVTLNVTLLVHAPGDALTVILPGQVIAGDWLSWTVTVNVH